MLLRIFLPTLVAVTLTVALCQPLIAHDGPHAEPQPASNAAAPEGDPRGEGGPRGQARPRGAGGPRPEETPEQRQERVERMLAPYVEMVPDLTAEQKNHIVAIMNAADMESRAVRDNTALSPERQRSVIRAIRGDISRRVRSALTEIQLKGYDELLAEQAETMAEMEKVGSVRPDEDVEQMRERVLKGYEAILEELSVKQKTSIIRILEAAAEESAAINADAQRTPEQKTEALRVVHTLVSTNVEPLLDKEQLPIWKKAHAAKRP